MFIEGDLLDTSSSVGATCKWLVENDFACSCGIAFRLLLRSFSSLERWLL